MMSELVDSSQTGRLEAVPFHINNGKTKEESVKVTSSKINIVPLTQNGTSNDGTKNGAAKNGSVSMESLQTWTNGYHLAHDKMNGIQTIHDPLKNANGGSKEDVQTNGHCIQTPSPLKANKPKWIPELNLVPTKTKQEVPELFREPHVERGFRELHQPWTYYLCSIFQLHNESMNVWTHMLAVALMTAKLIKFCQHVDFINDPYSWPLLAGITCGITLYSCSSGAHCMQSKSELIHYVSFMIDYAGIGVYGLGSVIVHLSYCSEDIFYDAVKDFFVPLGGILAFLICYCCTVSKVIYSRPYPFIRKIWQMSPVGGIYAVLITPIIHRLWTCYAYGEDCNESIPYHVHQVCWFIMSGLFFASDFPQRIKPGCCDHFFHSHQIFHVCIMMSTLMQMDGVFVDFQTRSEVFRKRPPPTLVSAFGPVFIVCLAEVLSIVFFTFKVKAKLEENARVKQD